MADAGGAGKGGTSAHAADRLGRGMTAPTDPICPLCDRPIPARARQSLHHLVPRLKGGARGPVVRLHQICHSTIHTVLTEAELARSYREVAALRTHPEIARFVAWVAGKPPGFHARSAGPRRRRERGKT
jgi:hypothetical protein